MKNYLFQILSGIALIRLIFSGCQKDPFVTMMEDENVSLKSGLIINYCGSPCIYDLVAGQNFVAGSVIIGNDGVNIYVTFKVFDDWWLDNTKVFLGTSPDEIPATKTGNPIRGQFTQDVDHNPSVKIFTHIFPLGKFAPKNCAIIAAHASVLTYKKENGSNVTTREEAAWGKGTGTFAGKAWGWYIKYVVKPCCPDHVVVFCAVPPWGLNVFKDPLYGLGFTYGPDSGQWEYASINVMGIKPLNPYHDLVIIINDQDQRFYDSLAANHSYFYNFVNSGGKMIWEAADLGMNKGSMVGAGVKFPSGIIYGNAFHKYNKIPNPSLPLVSGLKSPLYGTSASHISFGNLPAESIIYCTDPDGKPTLFEFLLGHGKILVTGQPWEFAWIYGQDVGPLLYRSYAYMLCRKIVPDAMPQPKAFQGELSESHMK